MVNEKDAKMLLWLTVSSVVFVVGPQVIGLYELGGWADWVVFLWVIVNPACFAGTGMMASRNISKYWVLVPILALLYYSGIYLYLDIRVPFYTLLCINYISLGFLSMYIYSWVRYYRRLERRRINSNR